MGALKVDEIFKNIEENVDNQDIFEKYYSRCKLGEESKFQQIDGGFQTVSGSAGFSEGLSLHSTRQTFASRLMRAGVPIHIICQVGG